MIERSNGFEDFIKECSEKRAGVGSLSGTEKQMPELSIESVHQLLLEDRKTIKDDVSINDGRTQHLMQNTNAIKELLQIKLFDDEQQFDEDNRQMVDSIALEIRELLFSDASDMMQGAMIGSPIECLAFAKWWIQREKGLKIREDIFSNSPKEKQAKQ